MAGSYTDAPDYKLWYNDDGSIVFTQASPYTAVAAVSGANAIALNDENTAAGMALASTTRVGVVFPNLTDVSGIFFQHSGSALSNGIVQTSINTTTGQDGDWVEQTTTLPVSGALSGTVAYRQAIQAVAYTGIKGIRISSPSSTTAYVFTLYGQPSAGAAPNRLAFWQPVTDAAAAASMFDFGDDPRGIVDVVQFRVKNLSPTLTANAVELSDDVLTAATPPLSGQTTFSPDGTSYTATYNIGSIAPDTISAIMYVKLALTSSAAVGLWRQRIKAVAGSWS